MLKPTYKYLLIVTGVLFICSLLFYVTGLKSLAGPSLFAGFVVLAFGIRGFEKLKGFSYTVWIFAAVTLSMLYPSMFIQVGDFQLKRLIVPLLQIIMFGMGSQMSLKDFGGVVKMPKGVIIGLGLQYTIMPVVGLTIAKAFNFPAEIAAGILLVGCAPSGLASNVMSYIAKANLALAVTLAALGTILSPFITPFLMKFLAGQYIEVNTISMMNEIINIIILPIIAGFIFKMFATNVTSIRQKLIQLLSYLLIIVLKSILLSAVSGNGLNGVISTIFNNSLIFVFLPIAGGLSMNYFAKGNIQWMEKIMSFISMAGIALIITVITAAGRDNLLQVGLLLLLASLIHNLLGYFFGYSLSKLFKMPERDCRTIAFEVGMQNGGLASGLALQMGKLATVGLAPAIFGPLMNITGSILATYWRGTPVKDEEIKS
jgi:bile acid:Na+ symporter, BASS family